MNFLDLKEVREIAELAVASGYFTSRHTNKESGAVTVTGPQTIPQAMIIIMKGHELGVKNPLTALQLVRVIYNSIIVAPQLLMALVKESSRYDYRVIERTAQVCTMEALEKFGSDWVSLGKISWTAEMARKAGTKNMDKFPAQMLTNRCMGDLARTHFPNIAAGVYVEGEIIEGEIIENDGQVTGNVAKINAPEQQKTVQAEAATTVDNHVINADQRKNLINNFVYAVLPDHEDKAAIKALIKAVFGVETTAQILVSDYESVIGLSGKAYERARAWLEEHYPASGGDEGIDDSVEAG